MISIREIADICQVSRGTVDRALNGRPGINQATRDRIQAKAKELGYLPDQVARSLATGRNQTIGVVIADLDNRFFGQMVQWIEHFASQKGYFINLALTHRQAELEKRSLDYLLSRRVDGILILSYRTVLPFSERPHPTTIPVVSFVNKISDQIDFVGVTDQLAIDESVELLAQNGHRRILYVAPAISTDPGFNSWTNTQRLLSFRSTMQKRQLDFRESDIILSANPAATVLARLREAKPPTAILAYNDTWALDILKVCKQHHIRVPADVSLMGFDDVDTLQHVEPGLTTISNPIEAMASLAIDILLAKLVNPAAPVQSVSLPHKLVLRESVARI